MFAQHSDHGYVAPIEGIRMKTLAFGSHTLLTEFRLAKGAVLPFHHHASEQTGYLVSGRIRLTIGAEMHEVGPGDAWCVPRNIMHGADILEDSVAIEVFSPLREDYLPDNLSTGHST